VHRPEFISNVNIFACGPEARLQPKVFYFKQELELFRSALSFRSANGARATDRLLEKKYCSENKSKGIARLSNRTTIIQVETQAPLLGSVASLWFAELLEPVQRIHDGTLKLPFVLGFLASNTVHLANARRMQIRFRQPTQNQHELPAHGKSHTRNQKQFAHKLANLPLSVVLRKIALAAFPTTTASHLVNT
jgi:hypothetical protein